MENNSKPHGRGYHKKRKKGGRSHFDRRKNDERRRQQANKENIGAPKPSAKPSEDDSTISLLEHWQKATSTENSQYYKVEVGCNGLCQMTKSVVLKPNGSWSVYAGSKEVPKACSILSQFSSPLSSNSELSSLIKT